jgi:hypothetical protein
MKTNNQSGFSLLQVMIAASLMSALAVMTMKQQETSSKMQSKMNYNHDVNTTTNLIQMIMANDKSCTATLGSIAPNGNVPAIQRVRKDPNTGTDLPPEKAFDNKTQIGMNLYINEMQLTTNPAGQDVFRVKFHAGNWVNGTFVKKENMLGGSTLTKDFAIAGEKDSGGLFTKCFSVESEQLDSILDSLPECMITDSSCTGAYANLHESFKLEVTILERRSCIGIYTKTYCGFGSVTPKTCYCTGPGCSCTTEWVSCFDREMQPCQKDNLTKFVTTNKCCKNPAPPTPPGGTGGAGGSGGGGGGGGCFVAGTQISLFSGETKNIEDVAVGDELLDGRGEKVVAKKLVRYPFKGKIYSLNGGGYFFTPNHPFKSTEGWKSLDPFKSSQESLIEVSMLKVGDLLYKKDGLEMVMTLDFIETNEPVYNFEVSGSHEYIADDYVVHNVMEEMKVE